MTRLRGLGALHGTSEKQQEAIGKGQACILKYSVEAIDGVRLSFLK